MGKITTLWVRRAPREGDFSVTEETATQLRSFIAWKIHTWQGMEAASAARAEARRIKRNLARRVRDAAKKLSLSSGSVPTRKSANDED